MFREVNMLNNWSENDILYGKYIGNFFYKSKPKKRFSLIWRPINFDDTYGEFMNSYDSVRAAEKAMRKFNLVRRMTLVDEITRKQSHYIINENNEVKK